MNRKLLDESLRGAIAGEIARAAFRAPRPEETARARAAEGNAAARRDRSSAVGSELGARSATVYLPAALIALALTAAGFAATLARLAGPSVPPRPSLAASISAALPDDPVAELAAIIGEIRILE